MVKVNQMSSTSFGHYNRIQHLDVCVTHYAAACAKAVLCNEAFDVAAAEDDIAAAALNPQRETDFNFVFQLFRGMTFFRHKLLYLRLHLVTLDMDTLQQEVRRCRLTSG